MSFMFNPSEFDDPGAVNRIKLNKDTVCSVTSGTQETCERISRLLIDKANGNRGPVVAAFEGYIGALWDDSLGIISEKLAAKSFRVTILNFAEIFRSPDLLDEQFSDYLPLDKGKDPVLLFGRLYKGNYNDLIDESKMAGLVENLNNLKKQTVEKEALIIYGCGCSVNTLRNLYDFVFYYDVAPKNVINRARKGLFKNLGDHSIRPVNEFIRRCYYIDYEIASRHRRELFENNAIDFYIDSNDLSNLKLIPWASFCSIMAELVKYPMRCKPVYLEGVWGGQYIKRLRNLPGSVRNVAWSYDLIPLEVSIVVDTGMTLIEFPFFTFVQMEGLKLMGEKCLQKFNGYFPVRFNYDDTYHGSGNMSVQVHPGESYIIENFNELGRQDESYYVVATGHGAKTFVGFNEDSDIDKFVSEAKTSEKECKYVDYEKYINHVQSFPGVQVMLPAGTVHASGRNQVVLETGSLTVGSYTFKLYDYLRADLDGRPRPIHTYHGERVLQKERRTSWVKENLVKQPVPVRKGESWAEYIIGEHDLLYFSLRRLEFETEIEDDTNGIFHVLALVDGEKVIIESLDNPLYRYEQNFLDIVIVPANIGRYIIKNSGNQPVCIHKTMIRT